MVKWMLDAYSALISGTTTSPQHHTSHLVLSRPDFYRWHRPRTTVLVDQQPYLTTTRIRS